MFEFHAPLASPRRDRPGADPAGAIADDDAVEVDRGHRDGRAGERGPARVPRLAEDTVGLTAEDQPQQVEMVYGHVDEQRLLFEVMAAATVGAGRRETTKVDRDLVQLAELLFADQVGDGAWSWKETVVLADHQDQIAHGCAIHQLFRRFQAGGERLLDQDVEAGVESRADHRDVARQRGGVEQRLRLGGGDRFLQRFEAPVRRYAGLLAKRIQRVGVGVDVRDDVDFT